MWNAVRGLGREEVIRRNLIPGLVNSYGTALGVLRGKSGVFPKRKFWASIAKEERKCSRAGGVNHYLRRGIN